MYCLLLLYIWETKNVWKKGAEWDWKGGGNPHYQPTQKHNTSDAMYVSGRLFYLFFRLTKLEGKRSGGKYNGMGDDGLGSWTKDSGLLFQRTYIQIKTSKI